MAGSIKRTKDGAVLDTCTGNWLSHLEWETGAGAGAKRAKRVWDMTRTQLFPAQPLASSLPSDCRNREDVVHLKVRARRGRAAAHVCMCMHVSGGRPLRALQRRAAREPCSSLRRFFLDECMEFVQGVEWGHWVHVARARNRRCLACGTGPDRGVCATVWCVLQANDQPTAQHWKHVLEERQRKDRKLRKDGGGYEH